MPDDVTGKELDKELRGELRTLSVEAAEIVSRHLVMAQRLLEDNPALAWEHAKAAVSRGGRLAVVREAAGVTAYSAGEFADALAQFRAARRISGSDSYWPIMADCERGLGRPERAISMAGADEVDRLDRAGRIEMRIVASGARRDLGQLEAAVVTLQCPELTAAGVQPWNARLRYAYADALMEAGREDEAVEWFGRAAAADPDGETDAAERLAELEGLVWEDTLEEGEDDDDLEDGDEDDLVDLIDTDGVDLGDDVESNDLNVDADDDLDVDADDVDAGEGDDDEGDDDEGYDAEPGAQVDGESDSSKDRASNQRQMPATSASVLESTSSFSSSSGWERTA